jgi:Tol biopolymer transport system component
MLHAHVRITTPLLRTALRTAAVLSAVTVVLSLPGAPAHAGQQSTAAPAFPPTVIRYTPLPLASMVEASAAASVTANGGVRVAKPLTLAPRVVCPPVAFTEVGLSWNQSGTATRPLSADIASATGGAQPFTGTVRMADAASSDGPDPGSPEFHPDLHSTEPLWTDTARCLRISLRLPAGVTMSDLRVVFINTLGTAFGGRPVLTDLPMPGTGSSPSGASSDAATVESAAEPPIITRTQWGANPKYINCFFGYSPALSAVFVHHTDTPNGYSAGEVAGIIRGIYAYHTNVNGWCDIGYNFLVDRFGRIYEGRQGGVDQPVIPAAQRGFNYDATAVAAIGTYTTTAPSSAMLTGIEQVAAWRLAQANRYPTHHVMMQSAGGQGVRYPKGKWVRMSEISGHRNADFTACPGNALYARLPDIRTAAARLVHVGGGTTLVFSSERSGSSQIWAERQDGANLRQITSFAGGAHDPALSPDATRVAFVGGTGNGADIYTQRLDGGSPHQVTDTAGFDGSPAWSPDGKRLAFMSDRSGNDDIWVTTLSTGKFQQVTTGTADQKDPTWAARGNGLAFASNGPGNFDIYTVNLVNGTVTRRTNTTWNNTQPAWSPDGTELAFVSAQNGNADIWTLDLESEKLRQMTAEPSADEAPTWSGDNTTIAFQSDRAGAAQIFDLGLNVPQVRQLTNDGGTSPGWRR